MTFAAKFQLLALPRPPCAPLYRCGYSNGSKTSADGMSTGRPLATLGMRLGVWRCEFRRGFRRRLGVRLHDDAANFGDFEWGAIFACQFDAVGEETDVFAHQLEWCWLVPQLDFD